LNRIEDLANAVEAKIVELKDNFVKYDYHLKMVLEESLAAFCKEIEETLLLESQTLAAPNTANVVPCRELGLG
ncbi:hypothetical protein DSO57_1028474, partial [Entomophthora muscae]